MPEPIRILVVDDAPEHARMVVDFLHMSEEWSGVEASIASTYDEALKRLTAARYDVAFFDYWLGARDGLSLIRDARDRGVDTPVVVLTGQGDEDVAVHAMKAGAADYLSKTNISVETLDRAIRHSLKLHAEEAQRRQAEAALRASEERFRALVENSHDALLLIDAEARVTYMTPSSERHLGWKPKDLVGRSIFDFIHPDDVDLVTARMGGTLAHPGEAITAEVRFRHADGGYRVMEGVGVNRLDDPSVGAIVVNARDITDRRRLEDQLRHSQKMEAVGQLAGGVAHDFNNLLTAILGYCNLLLDELDANSPLRADLEEIRSAGDRAAALTRQLLAFSRRQMLQPQVVDVNLLVQQMEKLLRRMLTGSVELATDLAPGVDSVKVDPSSIEQVVVNLTVNARDSMPSGGRITIRTANVDVDAAFAAAHVPILPGRYVLLAVADSGEGMDEPTRRRIFEPFFTTREQGKGTGLGLATVYGIVKQSGGYIWVESEPGSGSTFQVYLPPAESVMVRRAADRPENFDQNAAWETVLLVEDEDAVRSLAREVLRRRGYVVIDARHAVEALRLAERHPDDIHLLLTDVVLPHMSGRDLAQRLSSVRPHMKVLFMSGDTDRARADGDLVSGSSFVQKPFTPETLARRVRLTLDGVAPFGTRSS